MNLNREENQSVLNSEKRVLFINELIESVNIKEILQVVDPEIKFDITYISNLENVYNKIKSEVKSIKLIKEKQLVLSKDNNYLSKILSKSNKNIFNRKSIVKSNNSNSIVNNLPSTSLNNTVKLNKQISRLEQEILEISHSFNLEKFNNCNKTIKVDNLRLRIEEDERKITKIRAGFKLEEELYNKLKTKTTSIAPEDIKNEKRFKLINNNEKTIQIRSKSTFSRIRLFDKELTTILSTRKVINYEYDKLKQKEDKLKKTINKEITLLNNIQNSRNPKIKFDNEINTNVFNNVIIQSKLNINDNLLTKLEEIESKLLIKTDSQNINAFIGSCLKFILNIKGYLASNNKISSQINISEAEINSLQSLVELIECSGGDDNEINNKSENINTEIQKFLDFQNFFFQSIIRKFNHSITVNLASKLSTLKLKVYETNSDLKESNKRIVIQEDDALEDFFVISKFFEKNFVKMSRKEKENSIVKKNYKSLIGSNPYILGNLLNIQRNENNSEYEYNKRYDQIKKSTLSFYYEKGLSKYIENIRESTNNILNS